MSLCQVCATLKLIPNKEDVRANQRLGKWTDLLDRASDGCAGCQFFIHYLTTYVTDCGGSNVSQFFTEQNDSMNARYGHGRDFDSDKYKDEVWIDGMRLLYKPAEMVAAGGSIYSCDELCLEVCVVGNEGRMVGETFLDYRRAMAVNPDDEGCYGLMRGWLRECEDHGCWPQGDVPLPKRVVDVGSLESPSCRLVETEGMIGRYVALSHRWGGVNVIRLETDREAQFMTDIPFETLARNYQDAIIVARNMGIRHMWLDVLCVLQDDTADRAREMSKMRSYYSNCTLLLSADAAENADTGLLRDRRIQYSPPLGAKEDVCLRPACLRWLDDVQESSLATRAWAIQERLLAPRILHFTKRQMMWECARGWKLEAAHEIDTKIGSGQPRYNKALVQPLLAQAQRTQPTSTERTARLYDAWFKCIQEFSGAELTDPSDKLPSVAGIAAALDDGAMGIYFAGVWLGAISLNLLWSRQFQLLTKPAEYRAPSWSWASLDGRVSMDSDTDIRRQLDSPTQWMLANGPKVLETSIQQAEDSSPYGGFLPGSFIKLEGLCTGMSKMFNLPKTFHPTVVLDTSNAFDCHCCRPDREVTDTTGVPYQESNVSNYICLIVNCDGWTSDKSKADCIILHPMKDQQDTYERVGMLRIAFDWPDNDGKFAAGYQGKSVSDEFDELGWDRRVLKLI